jgi:large subunit ribosomal protein L29
MVKKIDEIRAKSDDALKEQIVTLKREGLNLRFQQASGELTNTNRRRVVKREVAMIKTVLSERASGKEVKKAAEAPKAKTAKKAKEK